MRGALFKRIEEEKGSGGWTPAPGGAFGQFQYLTVPLRELRPVITTGAEVMDQIFRPKQQPGTAAGVAG